MYSFEVRAWTRRRPMTQPTHATSLLDILIVSPRRSPPVSGNAITVARIASALRERGAKIRVATPAEMATPGWLPHDPLLVHAFHARISGSPARVLASRLHVPLVITVTGTDAHVDLARPEHRDDVLANLRAARSIVVFHASVAEVIQAADATLASRTRIIPQTPDLASSPLDFRDHYALPRDAMMLFLPGGIRPVKGTLFPFAPLRRLRAIHPELLLVLAGPRLDSAYADRVDRELSATPGAAYIGEVPHEHMSAALRASDLVLNCSDSEGGMANTVLEAMATGAPVLVRAIPGNLSLVREGVTGLTFDDESTFEAQVERVLAAPREVKQMAQLAREEIHRTYRRDLEAQSYEAVYRELLSLP